MALGQFAQGVSAQQVNFKMYAIISLLLLILSAVFTLKAKIGVTDEKKLEDFKPTLATPFRTILVWGISVEMITPFIVEGIDNVIVLWWFTCVLAFFWYTELAEKYLTYEEYDHKEYNKFTATFSKRQWLFLFLFAISTTASVVFYDKAFQIVEFDENFLKMQFWVWIICPMMLFMEEHISTKALRFLFFCITCVVIF